MSRFFMRSGLLRIVGLAACGLSGLLAMPAPAQAPTSGTTSMTAATGAGSAPMPTASSPSVEQPTATEVIQPPRIKHQVLPEYPHQEETKRNGGEGWVQLEFMVDPNGKPYEIAVTDSTGNKTLEQAAIDSLQQWTFEPGSVNGKAVESSTEILFKFHNPNVIQISSPTFRAAFEQLMAAIQAGNRAAADSAMKALDIDTLYEDAYVGIAKYNYATKWGDEWQQLEGLRRATATGALPDAERRSLMLARLQLQLKLRLYAEALSDWDWLKKPGMGHSLEARIQPVMDRVEKIRTENGHYDIQAAMPEGHWGLHLFKRHFHVAVTDGSISQVKLRCGTRFLSLDFDPNLQYDVSGKYGDCHLELLGTPGARFILTQS